MCGVDSEVEGDPWGAGDPYYGDRVGGEGAGDCQGLRTPAQTTTPNRIEHRAMKSLRPMRFMNHKKEEKEDGKKDFNR